MSADRTPPTADDEPVSTVTQTQHPPPQQDASTRKSTHELFAEGLKRVNVKALMEAEEEYGDDVERELADLEAAGHRLPVRKR